MLSEAILPTTQYYAYIEIGERDNAHHWSGQDSKELWRGYAELAESSPNFAMRKVAAPADIYPVFRELFARQREKART